MPDKRICQLCSEFDEGPYPWNPSRKGHVGDWLCWPFWRESGRGWLSDGSEIPKECPFYAEHFMVRVGKGEG